MCKKNMCQIHVHSENSILDGFGKIKEYVERAKELDMIGLGLTDHGTATGLYQFIKECNNNGLIPVPGVEFYLAPMNPDGAKHKKPVFYKEGAVTGSDFDVSGSGKYTHMTIFAYNNEGMKNLYKLSALSWQPEHYYGHPRVDIDMIAEHSEGLIATTGCMGSEINKRFLLDQDQEAYEFASRLKSIFGENLYIEIMNTDVGVIDGKNVDEVLMEKQIKLSKDMDIKLIATNDSHYCNEHDAKLHERMLCIQSGGRMSDAPKDKGGKRFTFSSESYYLKSYEEMYKLFPEEIVEEALANTELIARQCAGITLDYDTDLKPRIEIPEGYTEVSYFKKLIKEGFDKKRANATDEVQKESKRRVKEEFEVLHSNDFISYFLVVHDYISWGHRNGVNTGAGRGSVGGSEIAYLLDIHDTDPIRFELLFERFLSPGRGSIYELQFTDGTLWETAVSTKVLGKADVFSDYKEYYIYELQMGYTISHEGEDKTISSLRVSKPGEAPDVDTDFHTEGREKVMNYVTEKYGKENVANIITFGTYKAKSSFKAMCTIYSKPFAVANKISSLIPLGDDSGICTLADCFDENSQFYSKAEEFRDAVKDEEWAELVEMAMSLEGRISSQGAHPCGLIISAKPLTETIPTQVRQKDGLHLTQWKYEDCESLGLIKMDFLGLNTVDIIDATLENISLAGKTVPCMKEIADGEMDDNNVYELLQQGQTTGIFQLASPGMQDLLKKLKPTNFMDIAAINALFRPGPMRMGTHIEYASRKNGLSSISFIHPDFNDTYVSELLSQTLGLMVFQEQIILIAQHYAGFTSKEADGLRKATGKKIMSKMMEIKPKFIDGCMENGGCGEVAAEMLWDTIEQFAKYAFNKCIWGGSKVYTRNGRISLSKLYKKFQDNLDEDFEIQAMWEDGKVDFHTIKNITLSGRKKLWTVKTESGKEVRITKEHRMLTTGGYGSIEDGTIVVGAEFATGEEYQVRNKKTTLTQLKNNLELSDGRKCDSLIEALAGEYLLSRGVEFEIKQGVFVTGSLRFGINASKENIVITPENYKDVIDEALMTNDFKGDKIVEITEEFASDTYDIEMEDNGPSNFIVNGLVSHNSHSVSYAINAFKTLFLKAHYPAEFMAALIQLNTGAPAKVAAFIQEANSMGLKVGPVSINSSQVVVAAPKTGNYDIVFGFKGVKQMNEEMAVAIVKEREKGNYKSTPDFIKRVSKHVKLGSRALQMLALAGAFDEFGDSRRLIAQGASDLCQLGAKSSTSPVSFFQAAGAEDASPLAQYVTKGSDFGYNDSIRHEANAIGTFISGHPVSNLGIVARSYNSIQIADLRTKTQAMINANKPNKGVHTLLCTITQIESKLNKSGVKNIKVTLNDESDSIEVHLGKPVVARIEKGLALAEIQKAKIKAESKGEVYEYKPAESKRGQYLDSLIKDDSIEPLEPLTPHTVYKMLVKTRGGGTSLSLAVGELTHLHPAFDGSLPFQIQFNSFTVHNKQKVEKLIAENKGNTFVEVVGKNGYMMENKVNISRQFLMQLEELITTEGVVSKNV